MEQKINFTTVTHYKLSDQELKHFYTAMALMQYPNLRQLNYNSTRLIRRLKNDFERFNSEIISIRTAEPNNLVLSQIQNYIQHHWGMLKILNKGDNF